MTLCQRTHISRTTSCRLSWKINGTPVSLVCTENKLPLRANRKCSKTPVFLICWPTLQLMQKDQNLLNNRTWKLRITVMLSIVADLGQSHISSYSKGKECSEKENYLVELCLNDKGWMVEQLTIELPREIWDRRPVAVLKKRWMLVLDAFRGCLTEKVTVVIFDIKQWCVWTFYYSSTCNILTVMII